MGRIDEIQAREQAATPGPWKRTLCNEDYGQGYGETTHFVDMGNELLKIGTQSTPDAQQYFCNAEFIAHAREDVPWLLEENARLTARVEALERALKEFAPCQTCNGMKECEKHGKAGACTLGGFEPDAWQFDEHRFMEKEIIGNLWDNPELLGVSGE